MCRSWLQTLIWHPVIILLSWYHNFLSHCLHCSTGIPNWPNLVALMRHEKNCDCIVNCCHALAQLSSNYAEIHLSVRYHLLLLLSVALKGPCANILTAPLWSPLMLFHNDFAGPYLVVKLWVLLSSCWPSLIALTLIGGMWRHIIVFNHNYSPSLQTTVLHNN